MSAREGFDLSAGEAAIRQPRLWPGRAQTLRSPGAIRQFRLRRAFGHQHQGDRRSRALGAFDETGGGGDSPVPTGRRRPAVIERHQPRAARGGRARGIPNRTRHGQRGQRRDRETQQQQRPGRLDRSLFLRLQVAQQPHRRKNDFARGGRRHPQQPVDHGQRQQAEKRQGRREGETH
jgi:hypothetical protein